MPCTYFQPESSSEYQTLNATLGLLTGDAAEVEIWKFGDLKFNFHFQTGEKLGDFTVAQSGNYYLDFLLNNPGDGWLGFLPKEGSGDFQLFLTGVTLKDCAAPVPLPGAILFLGSGLLGLLGVKRRVSI